jgi:hypothetical protein
VLGETLKAFGHESEEQNQHRLGQRGNLFHHRALIAFRINPPTQARGTAAITKRK